MARMTERRTQSDESLLGTKGLGTQATNGIMATSLGESWSGDLANRVELELWG
jgi:hypothetical protein